MTATGAGSAKKGSAGTPRWSPDGQLIAFDSNLEGHYEIYVVPAAGGKPRRVTYHSANDHVPSFSRDGQWIYFSSNRTGYIDQPSGEFRLQFFDFATGRSTTVAPNLGEVWLNLTASPDGRAILYTRWDSSVNDLMLVENFR